MSSGGVSVRRPQKRNKKKPVVAACCGPSAGGGLQDRRVGPSTYSLLPGFCRSRLLETACKRAVGEANVENQKPGNNE